MRLAYFHMKTKCFKSRSNEFKQSCEQSRERHNVDLHDLKLSQNDFYKSLLSPES